MIVNCNFAANIQDSAASAIDWLQQLAGLHFLRNGAAQRTIVKGVPIESPFLFGS